MEKFEISLWEDYLVGTEDSTYYDERKLVILGSDTMTESIRACNPKLISNINGTNTFTFDMVMYCEDIQLIENGDYYEYLTYGGDFLMYGGKQLVVPKAGAAQYTQNGKVKNPWLDKLTNERKIKVKWRDKWYDFLIKSKQVTTDSKMVSITCKDLYQTELGKNGYNLEFDNELMNNSGTIREMVDRVIEGTDWKVSDTSEDILQLTEEALYYNELDFSSIGSNFKNCKDSTSTLSAVTGTQNCFFFYSQVSKTSTEPIQLQIIYNQNGNYPKDDGKMLITDNSLNYYYDILCNVVVNTDKTQSTITPVDSSIALVTIDLYNGVSVNYRGDRFVRSEQTQIDTRLKKSVTLYEDTNHTIYCGYKETEFTGNIEQLISNSSNFSNLNGWTAEGFNLSTTEYPQLKVVYPELSKSLLQIVPISGATDCKIYNTGIVNNLSSLPNGISKGNEFWFRYKIRNSDNERQGTKTTDIKLTPHFVYQRDIEDPKNGTEIFSIGDYSSFGDWICAKITIVDDDATYSEINNKYWHLYFTLSSNTTIKIEAIELFEYQLSEFVAPEFNASKRYAEGSIISYTTTTNNTTTTDYYRAIRSTLEVQPNITTYTTSNSKYWQYNYNETISTNKYYEYKTYETGATYASLPSQLSNFWSKQTLIEENKLQVFPDDVFTTGIPVQKYYFYNRDNNRLKTKKEEMVIESYTSIPTNYTVKLVEPEYGKIRTISQKESNRFNILQTISENFEAYLSFEIEHEENGKIKRSIEAEYLPVRSLTRNLFDLNKIKYYYKDDNGEYQNCEESEFDYNEIYYIQMQNRPQKNIKISSKSGQETGLSFKYGLDLKSIQRTDASDNIVTKTIVKPNSNECATNGFCTIARSNENYSKANYIINFDYYITQGLLDKETVYKDIYHGTNSLYEKLRSYNSEYDAAAEEYSSAKSKYDKIISDYELYSTKKSAAEQQRNEIYDSIVSYYTTDGNLGSLSESVFLSTIQALVATDGARAGDTKLIAYVKAYEEAIQERDSADAYLESVNISKATQEEIIEDKKKILDEKAANIEEEENKFYKKYSRYIQEGTWTSDSYVDDNLYYLDALNVSYKGSRPTVSYTINAVALAGIEGFELRQFNLGDICYIQDTDYFGYKDNVNLDPYKEKVLITEVTFNFMNPSNDSFKIQNYKTQFEDLFQKITASVQSLNYAKGDYDRASNSFTQDGYLQNEVLQDSIDNDGVIISGGKKTNIVIDPNNKGIIVKKDGDPGEQLRVTSDGILGTEDGGETWTYLLDSHGMSSKRLDAGDIDVNSIILRDGANPNFRWDYSGLNAYGTTISTIDNVNLNITDYSKFVRFDKYGLYGMENMGSSPFIPTSTSYSEACKDIRDQGMFGLIWDGFFLNNSYDNSSYKFQIDNKNDLTVAKKGDSWQSYGYLTYTSWSNLGGSKLAPIYYSETTISSFAKYKGVPFQTDIYFNGSKYQAYRDDLSNLLYQKKVNAAVLTTTTISSTILNLPDYDSYYYDVDKIKEQVSVENPSKILESVNSIDNNYTWEAYDKIAYLLRYWDNDKECIEISYPAYQQPSNECCVKDLFNKDEYLSWYDEDGNLMPMNYTVTTEDVNSERAFGLGEPNISITTISDEIRNTTITTETVYQNQTNVENALQDEQIGLITTTTTVTSGDINKKLNDIWGVKECSIYYIPNRETVEKIKTYRGDYPTTTISEISALQQILATKQFYDDDYLVTTSTSSHSPNLYYLLEKQNYTPDSKFSPNASTYFDYINYTEMTTSQTDYIRGAKYYLKYSNLPFVKIGKVGKAQDSDYFGLEISKPGENSEQEYCFQFRQDGMYINTELTGDRDSSIVMTKGLGLYNSKEQSGSSIFIRPEMVQMFNFNNKTGLTDTLCLTGSYIETPKLVTQELKMGTNNFVSLVGKNKANNKICTQGGYYDFGSFVYVDCRYDIIMTRANVQKLKRYSLNSNMPIPVGKTASLIATYILGTESLDQDNSARKPIIAGVINNQLWFQSIDPTDKYYWDSTRVGIRINGWYRVN